MKYMDQFVNDDVNLYLIDQHSHWTIFLARPQGSCTFEEKKNCKCLGPPRGVSGRAGQLGKNILTSAIALCETCTST